MKIKVLFLALCMMGLVVGCQKKTEKTPNQKEKKEKKEKEKNSKASKEGSKKVVLAVSGMT